MLRGMAWGRAKQPQVVPLAYGGGDLDVVGETRFVDNIAAIRKAAGVDPDERLEIDAWVVAEPTNPHDKNAVAIAVPLRGQAHVVGYLPRAVAAKVAPIVVAANRRKQIPAISIEISDAFIGREGSKIYSVTVVG